MYMVIPSVGFGKSLGKLRRSGKFNEERLVDILSMLKTGQKLPEFARDHQLQGHMQDYRECHIKGDIILQYKRNEELRVITLTDIGTHHELLGR